jgi:hypothetical protein
MCKFFSLWTLLVFLAGCANLSTIDRSTELPKYGGNTGNGLAVHLDAEQRLLISTSTGLTCAEPSPDALSATSAGQSAGASAPSQGAASLAFSLQETASSIGVRTQSIALQREILFRLCESFNNKGITSVQFATLLARSQDLTAVVLAVEQLTGAVSANQVILAGSSDSSASASLISNQEALASARENENSQKTKLDGGKTELKTMETTDRPVLGGKVTSSKTNADAEKAKIPQNTAEVAKREGEWETAKSELDSLDDKIEEQKSLVEYLEANYQDAKKVREAIESNLDSALTSANSRASGSGKFSVISPQHSLSKGAAEKISTAVQAMVSQVLKKSYLEEQCIGLIAESPIPANEVSIRAKNYNETVKFCITFIKEKYNEKKPS